MYEYAYRQSYPDVLQVGRQERVRLEAWLTGDGGGTQAVPTACTWELVDEAGTVIIASGAVAVAISPVGTVTVTVPSSSLPTTLDRVQAYQEIWTVTLDGVARQVDRECWLSLRPLYPVLTPADITRQIPTIAALKGATSPPVQGWIDEAWADLVGRLIGEGHRPEQVKSQSALRLYHQHRTYALLYAYLSASQRQDSTFTSQRDYYADQAERAWARMTWREDADQDGHAESDARVAASRPVHLAGAPGGWRRRSDPRF